MTRNDPNPKEKSIACQMCGKPLPRFSKGSLCGTACRKAKSRLKTESGKNAIDARNAIRKLTQALDLDMVNPNDIASEYNEISALLNTLFKSYDAAWERKYNPKPKGFVRDDDNKPLWEQERDIDLYGER